MAGEISDMNRLLILIFLVLIIGSCSIKIPPGSYSTAPPISMSGAVHMAGIDLTLEENGRFQFNHWSDDAPPTIGIGRYKIVGRKLKLIFENAEFTNSEYATKEIECAEKDTQMVNFIITEKNGDPLVGVNIYNKEIDFGTISQIDGVGRISLPKESVQRKFQLHYLGFEDMFIEFSGQKCYDIDIIMKEKIDQLNKEHAKTIKIKKEGDQFYIKMEGWKSYSRIFLKKSKTIN